MRLHNNHLTYRNVAEAASVAQAHLDHSDEHGSTVRDRAFEVKLVGGFEVHSARRPNNRGRHGNVDYAATWDQWGVFLRHLYQIDPRMVCGSPSRPVYGSLTAFNAHTDHRFEVNAAGAAMWPRDEHGDHRWQPGTEPRTRECTRCTARQIFPV